jgi:hypothetical protein
MEPLLQQVLNHCPPLLAGKAAKLLRSHIDNLRDDVVMSHLRPMRQLKNLVTPDVKRCFDQRIELDIRRLQKVVSDAEMSRAAACVIQLHGNNVIVRSRRVRMGRSGRLRYSPRITAGKHNNENK